MGLSSSLFIYSAFLAQILEALWSNWSNRSGSVLQALVNPASSLWNFSWNNHSDCKQQQKSIETGVWFWRCPTTVFFSNLVFTSVLLSQFQPRSCFLSFLNANVRFVSRCLRTHYPFSDLLVIAVSFCVWVCVYSCTWEYVRGWPQTRLVITLSGHAVLKVMPS